MPRPPTIALPLLSPVVGQRTAACFLAILLALGLACAGCGPAGGTPAHQSASAGELLPAAFDSARAWTTLERIVGFGPRPAGSAELDQLRLYLEGELRALGLEPQREAFEERTPRGPVRFENLFVDLPGKRAAAQTDLPMVLLVSHIDTKRLPVHFVGANDGGSSSAVLLELARVLAPLRGTRPVDYRLLFVDGEEAVNPDWVDPDNRYGSRYHAAQLARSGLLERLGACVVFDMVGDKDLQLVNETLSDKALKQMFFSAARGLGLERITRGGSLEVRDDHVSFMNVGVPSVDLIDFSYGGADNRYWHTSEDTLDKCSAASLDAVGRMALAALPELEAWVLDRKR